MDSQELTTRVPVRCPRCWLLRPDVPVREIYNCGACRAVLGAKKRREGLAIKSAPVNQLLDHVSRDSESVSSDASMGEVRARNPVRNEKREGLIIEQAPVKELLDHVSRDSETVNADASMGEVRAKNQVRNDFSNHTSQDLGTGGSDVSSMPLLHPPSSNGANNEYMQKQAIFKDWIFLIVSIILEVLSAAFDQASSPSKSHYALFGMLCAIVAVITCIYEFIHKGKRDRSHSFPDICALVGAIPQCIFSTVQYVYHSRHADNPINLCLWPIVFLFCLVFLRLIKNQNKSTCHNQAELTGISVSNE